MRWSRRDERGRTVGEALGVTEATINVAISQAPGLIFQVQVDGTDEWLGDEPPVGIAYERGEIFFDPADKTLPLAGRRLVVRYGPVDDGAPIRSLYAYTTVNNKRMRATQKVHDLLFTHRGARTA